MRFMKKLKTILTIICIFLPFSITKHASAIAPDAREIMKKVDQRYMGDTRIVDSTLILIDKKGRQRIRRIKQFAIDTKDVDKSISFFQSPPDVKGTSYMTYDWQDDKKEDDSWLYLPALQKIKRIAVADESKSFMGSDFSYADINGYDIDDFSYSLIAESELVDGHDCWVVRSIPKSDAIVRKTGYTEITSWVRKGIYMQVKSVIKEKKRKRVKYFSVTGIENIDNIWTAKALQMVTTRNGKKEHASVFRTNSIQYNKDLKSSIFNLQTMQRGN